MTGVTASIVGVWVREVNRLIFGEFEERSLIPDGKSEKDRRET